MEDAFLYNAIDFTDEPVVRYDVPAVKILH